MSKKLLAIIGLLLIITGVVISTCVGFEAAKISGYAVTMFGAGLATCSLWQQRRKVAKNIWSILAIVCVGAGAFMIGFTGFISEVTMTTIIGYTVSAVLLILGIVSATIANQGGNNDR